MLRLAVVLFELALVAAWTAQVARPYLDLDPLIVPGGREYMSNIQTHHLWTRLAQCGGCAFWNGSVRGGYPAFADPHGSMLHPLVGVTTLAWGVQNGAKLALAAAIFAAGAAQWLVGRLLGVGLVPRLWAAGLAAAGGYLTGRMEQGNFGVLLATSACCFFVPAAIYFGRQQTWASAVWLAVAVASIALSGQGYLQFGLALAGLSAAVLLLPPKESLAAVAVRTGFALLLALLLAAPFLLPFAHFLPQFGKDTDPTFRSAQPLAYVPLNVLISDPRFYQSEALGKLPYPYLYTLFLGWLPILLAGVGLARVGASSGTRRRELAFLVTYALASLWAGSAQGLPWLAGVVPASAVSALLVGLRFPSLIAGMAPPAILGLSAVGLDWVLSSLGRLSRRLAGRARLRGARATTARLVRLAALAVAAAFLWRSLDDTKAFARHWLRTDRYDAGHVRVLEALRTPDAQWTNPPPGEQFWIEPAIAMGLKLNLGTQGWYWLGRPPPPAYREAHRQSVPPGMVLIESVGGVQIFQARDGADYAAVASGTGPAQPCAARALGGHIDVDCQTPLPGILTVRENAWTGWTAYVNGAQTPLLPSPWLQVPLPPGSHTVQLRYQPWDAPLGLALAFAGALCASAVVLGPRMRRQVQATAGAPRYPCPPR